MKIAVIGSNGFIGARVVEFLYLGSDHTVVPIVRRPSGLALAARFAVDWRIADALASASLRRALVGCEAVVHAALGRPSEIERMPKALCEAAQGAGVRRLVYLSTASVHGQAPPLGATETSPLHTRHVLAYNNAKVRAERSFFQECSRRGLEGFALRPGLVYGPRSRWIADAATDLRNHQAWLLGDGSGIFNGIYVDNLYAAILASLRAPSEAAGVYLVSDERTTTWQDFYYTIAADLEVPVAHIHRVDRLPDFTHRLPDRLVNLAASPFGRTIRAVVPTSLKRMAEGILQSRPVPASVKQAIGRIRQRLRNGAVDDGQIALPPSPRITLELGLLQQCRWHFPHEQAVTRLGYRPPVDFQEGVRRSMAWLAFAEGRRQRRIWGRGNSGEGDPT